MSLIKEFIEYWAQFLPIYYAKQEKVSVETQTIYNNSIEHIPKVEHHIYNKFKRIPNNKLKNKLNSKTNINTSKLGKLKPNKNSNLNTKSNKVNDIYNSKLTYLNKIYKDIQNIIKFNIGKLINNKKNRLNFYDSIYLIFIKCINNDSFQDLSDELYLNFDEIISKNKICKKYNDIDCNIIDNLNKDLIKYIKNTFDPINNLQENILTGDGSDMKANIELKNEGYDAIETDRYTTPYNTFVSNYNYEIIEDINTSKKYNERKNLKKIITKKLDKQNLIILDAGYPCFDDFNYYDNNGQLFLVRLPSEGKFIKSIPEKLKLKNDFSYFTHGKNYRIIKYKIDNISKDNTSTFYLITNYFDKPYDEIKEYYNFRWKSECDIDCFKNQLGGKFYNVKSEKALILTMKIQHCLHLLNYIFRRTSEQIFGKKFTIKDKIQLNNNLSEKYKIKIQKKDFNKINVKSSLKITVHSILHSMIYNTYNSKEFFNDLNKIHNTEIQSILSRKYLRNPTKKDINSGKKELCKYYSKNIVKEKYGIDIYFNINNKDNTLIKLQSGFNLNNPYLDNINVDVEQNKLFLQFS